MKVAIICYWAAFLTVAAGWVLNVIDIIRLTGGDNLVTAELVIRCVGVFIVPLGAVFGWFW